MPRHLHAGAWWLWALGLAAAASRTTNPLLLLLLVAVAGLVVAARRSPAPWARSYGAFLKLGLVVIALRVLFQAVFGAGVGGSTVLVTLPEVPLPEWAAGVRVGGPVTLEALVLALYDGLRLATILACIGAANALADPRRLLRSVPAALYEAGVAVVVAMSFAPRLVEDAQRVRAAHRLRGRPATGLRALTRVAMPVLEGSLERSVDLAAAMDSRGFGRRTERTPGRRRAGALLVTGGLVGVCVGVYGLLDGGSPARVGPALLVAGLAAATAGFVLGGRGSTRTRYRPDPWGLPEWLVAGSGLAAAAAFAAAAAAGAPGTNLLVVPLVQPTLPVLPLAGALVAMLPAVVAPPPPGRTPRPRPVPVEVQA
ncbi:MAG TPA: energy-coupling factor transporter transmembrane component T [Jiangellales bacterium]|nr:energy-coupling factor transporter transmembrane component T [Jiangellales bacterium]